MCKADREYNNTLVRLARIDAFQQMEGTDKIKKLEAGRVGCKCGKDSYW